MGSASGGYHGARCHGNKSPGDRELSQLFPRLLFCGELYLTIIELTMWQCVWQPTPKTADVTVNKIAGYGHVRLLVNR